MDIHVKNVLYLLFIVANVAFYQGWSRNYQSSGGG